jgi:hypothetical protein
MIRRALVSCAACALAAVCVLTPAVPQALQQGRNHRGTETAGPYAGAAGGRSERRASVRRSRTVWPTNRRTLCGKKTTEVRSGGL